MHTLGKVCTHSGTLCFTQCMWIGRFACAPRDSSRLSKIDCPSTLGPKAHGLGYAGDTLGYNNNNNNNNNNNKGVHSQSNIHSLRMVIGDYPEGVPILWSTQMDHQGAPLRTRYRSPLLSIGAQESSCGAHLIKDEDNAKPAAKTLRSGHYVVA